MIIKETVKINPELLKRIKILIKNKDKKIKYSTAKQFVNVAVLKLLEVLSTITGESQSKIARDALKAYLEDMKNGLSEDTEKAELIERLLRNT